MKLGLEGRACIVTGATRGIGRAVTAMLIEEGASVLGVGRDEEELGRACAEVGAVPCVADLAEPGAGEEIVDRCLAELGHVDVLVNNAGATFSRPLEQLEDGDWQQLWDLHVMAAVRIMRRAAPLMAAARWGRIVTVASSAGRMPTPTNAAYSVTKAAQMSLSRAYADAYAPVGVLVNSISPGAVSGAIWEQPGGLADQLAERSGEDRADVLARTVPTVI
jgi:3-oxoacyl-[acyl-carrier protein] reductase